MQRKPANRLGLRGASEVKEHPWIKNYQWNDLYEKKLLSPFCPKLGDNFDSKYCNAPDKIGVDTYERYESFALEKDWSSLFPQFTFYNVDFGKSDNASKNKFKNPHLARETLELSTNIEPQSQKGSSSSVTSSLKMNDISQNMQNKILTNKKMTSSASTNSLMRHYKNTASTSNLASPSISLHKRNQSSSVNFNIY